MEVDTDFKQQGASFSGFTISTAFGQFMVLLFSFLLVRYFGPEISGEYTTAYTLTTLTSIAFNLGLDTWMLRAGALSKKPKETLGSVLRIKIIAGLIWAVLLLGIASSLKPELYPAPLLAICIIDVWFDSVLITALAVLNIQRQIKHYSWLILLSRGLKLLGLIALMVFANRSLIVFAGWRALCSVVFALIALMLLKPDFGNKLPRQTSEILSQSRSFALSELLSTIYMHVDVVILSNIKGVFATGIYSPALSLVNALFVLPNALYSYFIPSLSRWFSSNQTKFLELAKKVLVLLTILGAVLSLGIGLLGKPLTGLLLGESFKPSGELMVKLSPILFLKSLEFGFAAIIVATNKQKTRLIPQTVAALASIILNLLLIPYLGESGAALVYLITELILFVSYGIIAFNMLNLVRRTSAGKTEEPV